MTQPAVLFLFKSARRERLGEVGPREFFYGFTEMAACGIRAELAQESDFEVPFLKGRVERLATRLLNPLTALNAATLSRFATSQALSRLNASQAIVATTNAQGLALGALKSMGLLTAPVLFLPMGVWPLKTSLWHRHFLRRWLKPLSLAPIGEPEARQLRRHLPSADLGYLPFGVDTNFWTPASEAETGDYVLSIGNDPMRDWPTLARAWQPNLPLLKLVTRRPVPASAGRIETIKGDWNARSLTDNEVRELYRRARFVVLPLRETIQPSGQSACLQAMACGKAVILSSIAGLWDSRALIDGQTCLLVPPGDPSAMARAAGRLADDPEYAQRLGEAARTMIESYFTIADMGAALAVRLQAVGAGKILDEGRPS